MFRNLQNFKKILLPVVLVGFPVFLFLWSVGPRIENDVSIRVLFVSYSGDATSVGKPTVTVLSSSKNSIIVIDGKEWDLPVNTQDFYRNNIILECATNSFPVHWGFVQRAGESKNGPSVTIIHSSRVVDEFQEESSYRFISTMNLMPYKESSTGKYICGNINATISNSFSHPENSMYIYFKGEEVFLSKTSISIESTNGKELNIPCPVSNPDTVIALFLNQGEEEILLSAPNQSYATYDPQVGFTLSTKFLEEKDPWGRYICKVANDPKLHSGFVNIIPTKDYIVNVIPANSTISLSSGKFDGKFICEAKESIILQMSKIRKFRVVIYKMNASWEFPYVARVQYDLKDLRHFSSITCKTQTGMTLHTWKFAAASMPTVSMSFQHDENANEFACCSQNAAKMKPHLEILDCGSPSECAVLQFCFKQNQCINKNKNVEDVMDCKIYTVSQVASGMVQCTVGNRLQQLYYFFNGFRLLSDENYQNFYDLPIKEFMMISTFPHVNSSFSKNIKYKFICKGSRFIFSGGFIWFIMKGGFLNEIRGEGYFDQTWIHNWIEIIFEDYETTAIYCVAPVLHSSTNWRNVSLQIDYRK